MDCLNLMKLNELKPVLACVIRILHAQYYSLLQSKFCTNMKECSFIGSSGEMLPNLEFNLVNVESSVKFQILYGHEKSLQMQCPCTQPHATWLS